MIHKRQFSLADGFGMIAIVAMSLAWFVSERANDAQANRLHMEYKKFDEASIRAFGAITWANNYIEIYEIEPNNLEKHKASATIRAIVGLFQARQQIGKNGKAIRRAKVILDLAQVGSVTEFRDHSMLWVDNFFEVPPFVNESEHPRYQDFENFLAKALQQNDSQLLDPDP